MSRSRFCAGVAIVALSTGLATAQVGTIVYPGSANSPLLCVATGAGVPELRPEGYTEQVGDILITCTGGPLLQVGAAVPTVDLVVYLLPAVTITSRTLASNGASEAILIVDEAGANVTTGAIGGYGPQAPQTLCSTSQQQSYLEPCQAYVGTDRSGQYQVAVAPGTSTPAQNVYQGKVGDFGANTVAFYNVPVLPPAYQGVSRTYRITNVRVAVAGGALNGTLQGLISVSPSQTLPFASTSINLGVVGPSTTASVNASPSGGGSPFLACTPPSSPALAARIAFTEGFATGFKTRVVPGGEADDFPNPGNPNYLYAGQAQNLAAPFNQNMPGGLYGGFAANSESGFILPALNATVSGVTYTAGLMDYGTRLKAVFTNIPTGLTLYVSTTNTANYSVPGGTNTAPYAVLVAANSSNEANSDSPAFTPLTSAIAASDGLSAYALTADASGAATAVWEVLNSNPAGLDGLTFGVYVTYAGTAGTVIPTNVALSLAPQYQTPSSHEPGFGNIKSQGGPWATISACSLSAGTTLASFQYFVGGTAPPSQMRSVTISPANLPVTLTTSGGSWLTASLSAGVLTVSANPAGLNPSSTPYSGSVKLSAPGQTDVIVPVSLAVTVQSALSVAVAHTGNFVPGELGATYSVTVSNSAISGSTNGPVSVTEQLPPALTLVSMSGTGWDCSVLPSCTRSDSLVPGASWPPILVTVNVASNTLARVANLVSLSGGASSTSSGFDIAATGPLTCNVTGDSNVGVADVQLMVYEAIGISPPAWDLNSDGAVNVGDVQIVIDALFGRSCVL